MSYLWCFRELNGEKEVLLRRLEMLLDGLPSSVASSTFSCGMIWPPTVQAIFLDCSCKVLLTSLQKESSPQDAMWTGGAVCRSGHGAGLQGLGNWRTDSNDLWFQEVTPHVRDHAESVLLIWRVLCDTSKIILIVLLFPIRSFKKIFCPTNLGALKRCPIRKRIVLVIRIFSMIQLNRFTKPVGFSFGHVWL